MSAQSQEFGSYIPLGHNPLAAMVMEKGCNILERLGFHWYLSAGTILGIRRDGGFIPHDTDIDVDVIDGGDRFPELEDAFLEDGFRPVRFVSHQRAFIYLGTIFDVYTFNREGDEVAAMVDELEQVLPARFFDTLGTIEFNGRTYNTPHPLDEYLEARYGPDWQTPRTSKGNWREDAFNLR